ERGLLGVTFDPNFASNNFVYVYYTVPGSPAHNRVSRFTANGDVALGGSELVLLNLDNLSSATNHNGGAIHFGPDGKLYIAVGENANGNNSQTLANLLGKILRINSDGSTPTDNPFFNTAGARKEIWALGLRNPFTFAFQPGTTRMIINDVCQSTWEEIDDGIAGSYYCWPTTEGLTSNQMFLSPLFAYGHGSLYYLSIGSSAVFRIRATGTAPGITSQPSSQNVMTGQSATFSVNASGTTPLSYQWQRNQANIPGANASSYQIMSTTLSDNGAKFRCIVSNVFGNATSDEATLT